MQAPADLHSRLTPFIGNEDGKWSVNQVIKTLNIDCEWFNYLQSYGPQLYRMPNIPSDVEKLQAFIEDFDNLTPLPAEPSEIVDRFWLKYQYTYNTGIAAFMLRRDWEPDETGQTPDHKYIFEISLWGNRPQPLSITNFDNQFLVLIDSLLLDLQQADPPVYISRDDIILRDGVFNH